VGRSIQSLTEPSVTLTIERQGQQKSVQIVPERSNGTYVLGIKPTLDYHLLTAITESIKTTVTLLGQMLALVFTLFTGVTSGGVIQSLSGPVGIVQIVGDATEKGMINLLYLTSIISLNLGLMNLLPIPALDGGRITFLLLETLRGGKKINPQKEGLIHFVGFTFLIGFTIFITYFDILKLLS
ncbi:MAG TPA: RIP metalloprotease RseP, partial [Firmicutes bacterium]|nr:RIP metalloprotease RseP [Bacillota bacterium]